MKISALYVRRTHCKNGHEFTIENTAYRKQKENLHRVCKACTRNFYDVRNKARREMRAAARTLSALEGGKS